MRKLPLQLLVFVVGIVFAVPGNSAKAPEGTSDPKFDAVGSIFVLPVISATSGRGKGSGPGQVRLSNIQKLVVKELQKKNYQAILGNTTWSGEAIEIEDAEGGSRQVIQKLGPPDAHWVMAVFVEDASSHLSLNPLRENSGTAKVSGFLFDKVSGVLMWKQKGLGTEYGNGSFNPKSDALKAAVDAMLRTLPTRSKQ
jgi:hypothetical protein